MKEAIVLQDSSVRIQDVEVPQPGPYEILIKVVVAGTNHKDWAFPHIMKKEHNSGDDIAGVVQSIGSKVFGITKGSRVAAFYVMLAAHGAFADYAVAPMHTVFPIPSTTSFEEAATVPLAAYTAAIALFNLLGLPTPWDSKAREVVDARKRPLIIYGASSAVGAYAIKLARAANIHPVIAVGSSNSAFVQDLLDESKGDCMLDHKAWKTTADMISALQEVVPRSRAERGRIWDVFDGVSEKGTWDVISKAVAGPPDAHGRKPRIVVIWPGRDYSAADPSVEIVPVDVGYVHDSTEAHRMFGLVWGQAFARGLNEGWLTPHPFEVVDGELDTALAAALERLKTGTVKAKKLLVKVNDTIE